MFLSALANLTLEACDVDGFIQRLVATILLDKIIMTTLIHFKMVMDF
jgi:hypothetical protein